MDMKLLVASDIHGSAYYCRKLIERCEEEKPEKVVLLGDFLYHGPRNDLPADYQPKKVIEMLNDRKDKIIAVRGNCDTEVDQMVLNFPIMADYSLLQLNNLTVYITHGHKYTPENPLPFAEGAIMLCGHTHVPTVRHLDSFIYMNCGSVSIPKDGTPHSYMTIENGVFLWKDVVSGEVFKQYLYLTD